MTTDPIGRVPESQERVTSGDAQVFTTRVDLERETGTGMGMKSLVELEVGVAQELDGAGAGRHQELFARMREDDLVGLHALRP